MQVPETSLSAKFIVFYGMDGVGRSLDCLMNILFVWCVGVLGDCNLLALLYSLRINIANLKISIHYFN